MRCFKLNISTGFVGGNHEDTICFEDEELAGMSEQEIDTMVDEALQDFVSNEIDSWWEEVEATEE